MYDSMYLVSIPALSTATRPGCCGMGVYTIFGRCTPPKCSRLTIRMRY